jgi:hypothetical protein
MGHVPQSPFPTVGDGAVNIVAVVELGGVRFRFSIRVSGKSSASVDSNAIM